MTSIIWTPLCYKDFGPSFQCFGDLTDLVNKSDLLEKNQRRKLYTVIIFSSGWQASLKKLILCMHTYRLLTHSLVHVHVYFDVKIIFMSFGTCTASTAKINLFFFSPTGTLTDPSQWIKNIYIFCSEPTCNRVCSTAYLPHGLGFLCSLRGVKFNIARSLPTI